MALSQGLALLDDAEAQAHVPQLLVVVLRRHPDLRHFLCSGQVAARLLALCLLPQLGASLQVILHRHRNLA